MHHAPDFGNSAAQFENLPGLPDLTLLLLIRAARGSHGDE
jgi:hypothetical protein